MPDGYLRVVTRIIKKINLSRLSSPIVASRSQRLSDVVAVSRKYLQDLKGRSLYAYLRKLISSETVFVSVLESGMLLEMRNGVSAAGPMTEQFLEAIEDGRLLPCESCAHAS